MEWFKKFFFWFDIIDTIKDLIEVLIDKEKSTLFKN